MSEFDKLDTINLPLDRNKILIEASAGTGKTFTIGLIAVRLLLRDEKPLNIDKIVLITFTEAATAELRKKTSQKINDAFVLWENEKYEEGDDLSEIIKKAKKAKDAAKKRANLQDAIARIDEMPIFTIHGFCTRLLSEFPFETQNYEKNEIIPDLSSLEERVIIDFWREEIEKLDDKIIRYLPGEFAPSSLKIGLNKVKNFPDALIKYGQNEDDFELLKYINEIEQNVKSFKEECIAYKSKVDEYSVKNKIQIKYSNNYAGEFRKIDGRTIRNNAFLKGYNACLNEYEKKLGKQNNIGNVIIAYMQFKLAKKFPDDLKKEKEKQKVIGFNDLIQNTYNAVIGDNEKILLKAVQKRYDAILVDEFQDTDKMQYKIFSYLFDNKPFFMIGDPKQAIYRFRGADINAYLEAESELPDTDKKTMKKNFRSHEKLLKALNTVYKIDNPFENEKIKYITVTHGKDLLPLKINNKGQKPFILQNFLYSNKDDFYYVKKGIIEEITFLLYYSDTQIYNSDLKKYEKITAKDIAILTRTNDEAKKYREELRESEKRIPAVIRKSNSVFKSDAADYLMRLLCAFTNSHKESSVKAAIMELKTLTQDDIKPFSEGYENWKNEGIMYSLNKYFDTNFIWSRLSTEDNAERNATNIRQLIDILDKEEEITGRIPERLIKRFSLLIEEGSDESEEKLETDDDAVQIMTIHTSKGLQFPVVFVPDITLADERKGIKKYEKEPPIYHKEGGIIIEYEISNREEDEDNAKYYEKKEIIEESARNFYVAATRTIYRIYIVNTYKNKNNDNYVLSSGQRLCGKVKEDENICVVKELKDLEYRKEIEKTEETEEEEKPIEQYPPKVFPYEIKPAWYRSSFSDISSRLENIDYTDKKRKELKKEEPSGGAGMGILLHGIFENIKFSAKQDEIDTFIEKKLKGYKEFITETGEAKKEWVKQQVKIILNKELKNAGKLSEVKDENKTAELNFFMYSDNMRMDKIKDIMKNKINEFESNELAAKYLNGAIDLVFLGKDNKYYILDWKSNILDDYSKDGIDKEAMIPHAYHLQYYIYSVALKRWLEKTKRDFDFKNDFGGVIYIFIRGIKEQGDSGIYFVKPDEIYEDIIKMDDCFGGLFK